MINQSKADRLIEIIHPSDEMFLFLAGHPDSKDNPHQAYFRSGDVMMQQLMNILHDQNIQIENIHSFLEFACGHGRFTRHLIMHLNRDRITVSDIYKDAVDFQKEIFGIRGFYSTSNPDKLTMPQKYDVIFVASLFSHLPEKTWLKWLKKLFKAVNDGGLLIFSTHGINCLVTGQKIPKKGFLFLKISESKRLPTKEYGASFVTRDYVTKAVKKVTGKSINKYYQDYLWNYQDVYVVKNI